MIDTSKLTIENWAERQLALYKWDISNAITAYFIARHLVNHDQSIIMLLFDTSKETFVADFPITEFIGYEGFIYSRQGWIFKNAQDDLMRVAKDNVWSIKMPEAIETDSTANHLFIWNDDTFWEKADSTTLNNFDFSNFNDD